MPVTKGKKKTKRERRRFGSIASVQSEDQPAASGAKPARPARRRGWEGPPWLNVVLGMIMVVAGPVLVAVFGGGLLLLVAYWVVGGFYLWRAYRQYQAKRTS